MNIAKIARSIGVHPKTIRTWISKGLVINNSTSIDHMLAWKKANIKSIGDGKCALCGKPVHNHGKKYRIKRCKKHFLEWLKERRSITCSVCGRQKQVGDKVHTNNRPSYKCCVCSRYEGKSCNLHIMQCAVCGREFTSRNRKKCCSKTCHRKIVYHQKTGVSDISDRYVKNKLRTRYSIKTNQISHEMLELGRVQLALVRQLRAAKKEITT